MKHVFENELWFLKMEVGFDLTFTFINPMFIKMIFKSNQFEILEYFSRFQAFKFKTDLLKWNWNQICHSICQIKIDY